MECQWAEIHVKCKREDKAHILSRIKESPK